MNKTLLFGIGTIVGGVVVAGLPYSIDVTHYELKSKKIKEPVKMAILSDLHCRRFGKEQSKILNILHQEKPDLVIIPGDLFDTGRDFNISFELIRGLKGIPTYFTSGNHDAYLTEQIHQLHLRLEKEGVNVLEDSGMMFHKKDTSIEIYGMSDHGRNSKYSSEEISSRYHSEMYHILISHRPDYIDFYKKVDCDMIISGHVHGGQWRIPGTHQGVYFPRQGLFPKYTEGVHDLNGRQLVISRGLASGCPWIPRLYNNPEIVIVTLTNQ